MDGFVSNRTKRTNLTNDYNATARGNLGQNAVMRTVHGARELHSGQPKTARSDGKAKNNNSLRDSITSSLNAIDESKPITPLQQRKKIRKKRLIFRITSVIIILAILIAGSFVLYKAYMAARSIFGGNIFGFFQQEPLKKDAYGRSNLLIVGTTEDDPAHPGGDLTDSMMVVSVDQDKKNAYMFSIPRDLYVNYGKACNSGYSGKINEYFACSDNGSGESAERRRMDNIRKFVGNIFGMDIQYVAHVNTMVIKDAVNAVGGVDINIKSRDPRGIFDPSIDWMCKQRGLTAQQRRQRCPTGHYIHFKNGNTFMDGDKAMWFSRARGVYGGYGLEESNFDREKNQQLVLTALKEKATSTGTITDFGKVTSLIDAMGKNLKMNIESSEVRTIMKVASEIQSSDIHRLSFVEKDNVLFTTGSVGGASIVRPTAGVNDYSEIKAFIKSQIYASPVSKENAKIVILNGGARSGKAKEESDKLSDLGMDIIKIGNAPEDINQKAKIYSIADSSKKTATRDKLKELYEVDVLYDKPSFKVAGGADFVVILGQ